MEKATLWSRGKKKDAVGMKPGSELHGARNFCKRKTLTKLVIKA